MSEGEDAKNVWNQVENRTPADLRFHLLVTVVTSFRSRLRSGSGIERKDASHCQGKCTQHFLSQTPLCYDSREALSLLLGDFRLSPILRFPNIEDNCRLT